MLINNIGKIDNSINSFIGGLTSFKGDIEADGPIRIDGKFYGRVISTGMVYIGKKSLSECNIFAKNVIIGGTIKGDIYAEDSLSVLKTAEIIGNIYSTNIKMDDGVIFDGECRVLSKDEIKKLIEIRKKEKFHS